MLETYWEAALASEVRYYDIGGVRTRSLESGSGDPIVFLHGTGGHAENFIYNLAGLAGVGHVYAFDLLGHGMNSRPERAYTIDAVIEHAIAFIENIGAKGVTLGGLSLGGLLASRVALRRPDLVSRLIHITTFGMQVNDRSDEALTQDYANVRDANKRGLATTDAPTIRQRMTPLVHDPATITEEMVAVRQVVYGLPGAVPVITAIVDDLYERRFEYTVRPEHLRQLKQKSLFVWGRYNPNPVADAETAVAIQDNASLVILEKSGHWPHIEERDAFNAAVTQFLRPA
jgi:2-hydroxy-6-oxonona-2,4-dienedioate hydrolase